MLRTAVVLFLSFAGLTCAQEQKITNEPYPEAVRKRLKSVTWDLSIHKLVWVVETGKLEGREFVPTSSDRYEISPDEARMKFAQETRGFSPVEAASLHKLLDTLSIYCAESVMWWDNGEGDKADPEQPEKHEKETVKSPPVKVPDGLLYAIARTLR
jgi:hypothetical protein